MNIQKFHPFILSTLFILPLFGCGGGGGGGSTPPPPPPTPRVAMIWSNGSPGCWGDPGDTCITGGVGGRTLQVTSSLASGFAGFCIENAGGSCVSRDLSAFKNGHLQFDVRLESSTVTSVSITLFTGLTYQIPMSSLSLGQFVHLSIPLTPDLFGTNGPQQVLNVFQYNITNSAPSGNQVVLIMNDIKWTAD
jgi:hypothetical protein